MSEHKTGQSNWTAEDKKLYWNRRNHKDEDGNHKPLRGQLGYVTVHQPVKDEDGNEQRVPLTNKLGAVFSRGKQSDSRAYKSEQRRAVVKQQRKATSRGE